MSLSDLQKSIIATAFDSSTHDLSFIYDNDGMIDLHIKLIESVPTITSIPGEHSVTKIVDPITKCTPVSFSGFKRRYKYIYTRWITMLRSCYDTTFRLYPYFGRRGIRVCDEFMDARKFCIWCLEHKLVKNPTMYTQYFVRIDKTGNYEPSNCDVIFEQDLHRTTNIKTALNLLYLVKKYEESHHPSVSYMTFYTRYFLYDFCVDDARSVVYKPIALTKTFGFKPYEFYESVADSYSCSWTTFASRVHDAYLMPGFKMYPYDMLKPEYSTIDTAKRQGCTAYKSLWDKAHKENLKSQQNTSNNYNHNDNDVYSECNANNVYDNNNEIYKET